MIPKFIDDGSFTSAVQDGPDRWRYPFFDRGDQASFECLRSFVIREDQYSAPALMIGFITRLGLAYLVEEGETQDVEGGLVRVQRTLASVPQTRDEPATYVQTIQHARTVDSVNEIVETTATVSATVRYEYGLNPFRPLIAPKVSLVFGEFVYRGGLTGTNKPRDTDPLEDSEVGIYKGRIYYRRTIYLNIFDQFFYIR